MRPFLWAANPPESVHRTTAHPVIGYARQSCPADAAACGCRHGTLAECRQGHRYEAISGQNVSLDGSLSYTACMQAPEWHTCVRTAVGLSRLGDKTLLPCLPALSVLT